MLSPNKKRESLAGKLLLSSALVAVSLVYGWWQRHNAAGAYVAMVPVAKPLAPNQPAPVPQRPAMPSPAPEQPVAPQVDVASRSERRCKSGYRRSAVPEIFGCRKSGAADNRPPLRLQRQRRRHNRIGIAFFPGSFRPDDAAGVANEFADGRRFAAAAIGHRRARARCRQPGPCRATSGRWRLCQRQAGVGVGRS